MRFKWCCISEDMINIFNDVNLTGKDYFGGLVQVKYNSSALAMELCLSGINPSIWNYMYW